MLTIFDKKQRKFFNDIKCDNKTFQNCHMLGANLEKFYIQSIPAVQDIINIAIEAFDRQKGYHLVSFHYNSISRAHGEIFNSNKYHELSGEYKLCGDIVIQGHIQLDINAWGSFVHEMAHKAICALFRNKFKPYNTKISKRIYHDAIPSTWKAAIDNNIFKFFFWHFWSELFHSTLNFSTFLDILCLYNKEEYEAEFIARYYDHLANNENLSNEYLPSMMKFHEGYIRKIAQDQLFLADKTSICNTVDETLNLLGSDKFNILLSNNVTVCFSKINQYDIPGLVNILGSEVIKSLNNAEIFSEFDTYDYSNFIKQTGVIAIKALYETGFKFAKFSKPNRIDLIESIGFKAIKPLHEIGAISNIDLIKQFGNDIIPTLHEIGTITEIHIISLVNSFGTEIIKPLYDIGVITEYSTSILIELQGAEVIPPLCDVNADFTFCH